MGDRIRIWLNRDDNVIQGSSGLWPVLELAQTSFLPKPATLEVAGASDRTVSSYLDDKIRKPLDKKKLAVALLSTQSAVRLIQLSGRINVTIEFEPGPPVAEIRQMFLKLIHILKPTYGRCHFAAHEEKLFDAFYRGTQRTFYASGLYWLNFFGPEEEARQGKGLECIPGVSATRIAEGLLLEVGSGPEEALSQRGEERLLAVTAAMPALSSSSDSTDEIKSGSSESARIVSMDGIRGFLDPVDQSFWITKHLGPDEELAPSTVRKMQALIGKGSPPVSAVHVLFSDEQAAIRNKRILEKAHVRNWFVNSETGQPSEVEP